MTKILHIMSGYGGGISSFILNIINSSDPNRIISDVACYTKYPDQYREAVEAKGGRVHTLMQVRLKRIFRNISEIRHLINNNHYDIVYIHMTDRDALYYFVWARTCGIKRVIVHSHQTNHDKNHGFWGIFKFKAYKLLTVCVADQLASCSKMASEFRFGKKYVDQHRVMHIPNSINIGSYSSDLTKEQAKTLRHSMGVADDEILIGHIGRFNLQKNHSFMIRLISYMKKQGVKFKFAFIGTGSDFNKIKEEADSLDVLDVALFLGRRNDVRELFQCMELSILPSFYEGLPTVAIECQAAGTPMLLSDSITTECDMGLGLLSFASLNESYEVWTKKILELSKIKHVDSSTRISEIKKRKFTSPEAAQLFTNFIEGKINTYNFEDFDTL